MEEVAAVPVRHIRRELKVEVFLHLYTLRTVIKIKRKKKKNHQNPEGGLKVPAIHQNIEIDPLVIVETPRTENRLR